MPTRRHRGRADRRSRRHAPSRSRTASLVGRVVDRTRRRGALGEAREHLVAREPRVAVELGREHLDPGAPTRRRRPRSPPRPAPASETRGVRRAGRAGDAEEDAHAPAGVTRRPWRRRGSRRPAASCSSLELPPNFAPNGGMTLLPNSPGWHVLREERRRSCPSRRSRSGRARRGSRAGAERRCGSSGSRTAAKIVAPATARPGRRQALLFAHSATIARRSPASAPSRSRPCRSGRPSSRWSSAIATSATGRREQPPLAARGRGTAARRAGSSRSSGRRSCRGSPRSGS